MPRIVLEPALLTGAETTTREAAARPLGVTAVALFFYFGAAVSGITALLLLFPGSALDGVWRLNPRARDGFLQMGAWAVPLMIVVCCACAIAAAGLWRRSAWGYWTALAVLTINLAGDAGNVLIARDWRTLIGLPIGGAMTAYLIARRAIFRSSRAASSGARS